MDLRAFLSCFAVATLPLFLAGSIPQRLLRERWTRGIVLGLLFGFGAIGAMIEPLFVKNGMIVDLRGPLLAAAGCVGGPLSALIAASLALSYRLSLWGVGVTCGGFTIVSTAVIGTIGHKIFAGRRPTGAGLAALGACVSCAVLLSVLLLPPERQMEVWAGIVPIALMSFVGTILFVLTLHRDRDHHRLFAQDALYRTIIEALPDCLTAKDREGRFVAANPPTAHLMGAACAADLIGKTDADFYTPDMTEMFRAEERMVLENIVVGPLDQEILLADGHRKWITSMKSPMLDRHGKVIGILTHNRDITDRKRLEAELQNTQAYLQEAINHMADGLVLYDRDRRIRLFNRQYLDLFPKTADVRVAGALFDDIVRASYMRGEYHQEGDPEVMIADRIRTFSGTADKHVQLGDGRTIEIRTRALPGSDTLVVFTDITAKKQLEQNLRRMASEDPLTHLANRATFENQLNSAHREAEARGTRYAVMMLDLDRFKSANDTYGHDAGDKLLVEVACRLRHGVREGTLVARLGGDEFAFLILADDIESAVVSLANRLMKSLKKPFRINEIELAPSGSLGIAYFPADAADPFELLRLADKALYAVKTRGGGGWAISPTAGEMRTPATARPASRQSAA